MRFRRMGTVFGSLFVAALGFAAPSYGDSGPIPQVLLAQTQVKLAPNVQAELDTLIRSAKTEGTLTWYSAPVESVAQRISNAFGAKYGVKTQFVRMTGNALRTRYSAEAESGNFAADAVITTGSTTNAYAEESAKKGWVEPISAAGLPVLKGGQFPERFNKGAVAVVQTAPWLIVYNTDKVKGGDIPADWTSLRDPKWRGQFIMPDPRTSDTYIEFWSIMLDRYGEAFFSRLRTQNARAAGAAPALQSLAAGEGSVLAPLIMANVQGVKDKGGPLDVVIPQFTVGVEMSVLLTARAKSRNPNAARLFANYVMSPDGNAVLNEDPGGMSIYDTSKLPKGYQSPEPVSASRRDLIVKSLGF